VLYQNHLLIDVKVAKMYKELQTILSGMPGENTLNADLKILEAYTRDVGRGVARLDYESMDTLGASTGDVIEIRGGELDTVKRELQEAVEWPMRFPEMYKQLKHTAPKGILLHGPSGTGKTMLAKAVATESEANFISIKGPELMSKWVGESEKGIRDIFRKARQASPCVIFFDEVDSIAPIRGGGAGMEGFGGGHSSSERMMSQLLTEMDGIEEIHDIVVIAATNRVDMIDTALLRPGRFDKIVYIPNPDKYTRERILQINVKGKPISDDIDLKKLVDMTEGFSGADVSSVANTAVSLVLHDYIQKYPSPEEALKHTSEARVSTRHFKDAVKNVRRQREMKPEEKINLSHYR
jgi:transitional endoplasmic reticulum ATPase